MDWIFWIGIALGAVLSLAASIVANLAMGKINNLLEVQKLKFGLRKEAKEKKTFNVVSRMHTGKTDRVSYFVFGSTLIVTLLLSSYMMAALSLYYAIKYGTPPEDMAAWFDLSLFIKQIPSIFALFVFIVGSSFAMYALRRMKEIMQKLNGFDDYKSSIERQFPQSDFWKI